MAFTYDYFGSSPVSIIFSTSTNFDGAVVTPGVDPVITPGVVVFPVQVGGGLIDFHTRPLTIKVVRISGPTSATLSIVYPGGAEIDVDTLTGAHMATTNAFALPVGAKLKMVSTGGTGTKEIVVVAVESNPYGGL